MNQFIIMSDKDNVAVALSDLKAGTSIQFSVAGAEKSIDLMDNIQFGHKFSLELLSVGEEIYKYGHVIGLATEAVEAGRHVHVHNVESIRARGDKK